MKNKDKLSRIFVSDFDGTISKKDFFWYAIENLLSPPDIKVWEDYLAGKISHIDALSSIFSKIRLSKKEFDDFILSLPIEESFVETVQYCYKNNIKFYIASAGADYYIKLILNQLKVIDKVILISNPSVYTQESGLQIIKPDSNYQFYSENYGINKELLVQSIKKNSDICIFAGDGGPDMAAAKVADIVFARGRLLELCKLENIKFMELESYNKILEYLKDE